MLFGNWLVQATSHGVKGCFLLGPKNLSNGMPKQTELIPWSGPVLFFIYIVFTKKIVCQLPLP
jgi:hypothetical protein